jgi:hypothetical protein
LAVATALLLVVFCLPTIEAQEHTLEILEDQLSAQPDADNGDRISTTVGIRNNGPRVTGLTFKATLKGSDGSVNEHSVTPNEEEPSIEAFSVAWFEIEFPETVLSETLEGHLIVEAVEDVVPGVVPLTLNYIPTEHKVLGIGGLDANGIMWWSFWAGVAMLVISAIAGALVDPDVPAKIFKGRLGELKVDMDKNWASTLTVVGGVLTTLVGAGFFPDEPEILTKAAFQSLSTLFPILVIVAGFVVTAASALFKVEQPWEEETTMHWTEDQQGKVTTTKKTETGVTRTVPVLPFMIGSSIVFWAVMGQLATTIILFEELQIAGHFARSTMTLAQVFFSVLLALGFIYVLYSVTKTVGQAVVPDPSKRRELAPLPPVHLP